MALNRKKDCSTCNGTMWHSPGHTPLCPAAKEQFKQYAKKWATDNPERHRAAQKRRAKRHKKRHPDAGRRAWLKHRFGITLEDYEALLRKQRGRCGICRTSNPGFHKSFVVDHDHDTKAIRGLLCNRCNRAIGLLGDSATAIRAALKYLMRNAKNGYAKES